MDSHKGVNTILTCRGTGEEAAEEAHGGCQPCLLGYDTQGKGHSEVAEGNGGAVTQPLKDILPECISICMASVIHVGDLHFHLELEIDERLHIAGLDLDDYPNENDDEERLDHQRATSHKVSCFGREGLWHEVERITHKNQKSDGLVGSTPLKEYLWLELINNLVEHLLCNAKGGSTEEYPQGGNKMEGDKTAYQPKHWTSPAIGILL